MPASSVSASRSSGKTEADYAHLTYDITLAAATTLARLNPPMTFVYVSGAGTDSTEKGRSMWARVKGRTENALLKLPFRAAYMFRPRHYPADARRAIENVVVPNLLFVVAHRCCRLLRALMPSTILTTEFDGAGDAGGRTSWLIQVRYWRRRISMR